MQNTKKLIKNYKQEKLTLGKFAKTLNLSYEKALKLLSKNGIDIIDYDFEDDMKFVNSI